MAEALPPLAEPDDLAESLGVAADNRRLVRALAAASADFRGAVHHPVSLVTGDVLRLDGTGTRTLRLPVANVQAVHSVVALGQALEVHWSADGLLDRADGRLWPCQRGAVTVTLDHGYDPVPEDVQAAVLDRAESRYRIRRGLASKQVGGINLTFDSGVTEQWVECVAAYRIRRGDRA